MDLLEPEALFDIVASYKVAAALRAVVELGIPDELALGPLTAKELSNRTGTDPVALTRLLRMLCSHGALAQDGEHFQNSPLTASLQRGETRDMFLGWQALPAFVAAWQAVAEATRSGAAPFEVAHGVDLHAYFADHSDARALYDAANASTVEAFQEVADAIDLSGAETVVSIGGASGIELIPILQKWPHVRGVLSDLPEALNGAAEVIARYGMEERIEVVPADSRRRAPSGDAYILSTVLRCLTDADAIAVLKSCRSAASAGASMHVIEMPIPEGAPEHPSATADLTAWVAYGGGDRTIAQWAELHQSAGWHNLAVTPLDDAFSVLTSHAD